MLKNLRFILKYKSFVLTVATTCFLNCALATEMARSQGLDNRISIVVEKKTLKETLDEISKLAQVGIIYSNAKGILKNPVTIHAKDQLVSKVLSELLSPFNFTYEIIGDQIVVKFDNTSTQTPSKIQSEKQRFPIKGKVTDTKGSPLPGATIKIKNGPALATTDSNGEFEIDNVADSTVLQISFVGYLTKNIVVTNAGYFTILLENGSNQLNEVSVVSTGYQTLPAERATGSFTLVDNKTFNRTVSPDILSRLKGVTNGLLFDNNTGNAPGISIRGRSTIFSNTTPLIVIDNFPFEGDLNTINPDDIENITVLKDAAAASIWGVRAGNGVIVITTKSGKLNQKPVINFNANVTVGDKPNLNYQPQLTSSEFIDVEQFLFSKGAYTSALSNNYQYISPVVALLQQAKLNPSFASQANSQIDALRGLDIRNQLNQYFYRKSSLQQYHVDVNGGGSNDTYYFSAGYNKDLPTNVAVSDSRLTLKAKNTYSLLNNKLKLRTDVTFSKTQNVNSNTQGYIPTLPYEQIADQQGNALPVVQGGGLRAQYTDTAGNGRLLDWKNRPLDELRQKYSTTTTNLTDYRLNLGLTYKIITPLTFSANYEYYGANTNAKSLYDQASFAVRNQVNTFSVINATTGAVTRPFPNGDIYAPTFASTRADYGRGQLDFNELFGGKHLINAIAGYEVREDSYNSNFFTVYNYNPATTTSSVIDLINRYPYYYGNSTSTLGYSSNAYLTSTLNRYISYYGNASYTYNTRYIVSGSYRKDESNLFGVNANQKGVPLWSTGLAWNVDRESFFHVSWLSSLQVKATYGYNGNVNKSISAYLTAAPSGAPNLYQAQVNTIINPPNDNLRWERVQNMNAGVYFSTKGNRLSGSLEYYIKNGKDLIGSSPIAPQTGVLLYTGNSADTHTQGADLQLNSLNIDGKFKWNTTWIFDYSKDKITDYKVAAGSNLTLLSGATISPLVGYPINPIFAFKWGGLDGLGNPQGYVNGVKSIDYTTIQNSLDRSQLDFFGSATPTIFGSFRNTFSYGMIELSVNLTYKFNYYFRAPALSYSSLFGGNYRQPDYAQHWQKPGDELVTNVPSVVYPNNQNRDNFYQYSSVQVEKGDHIRLQDIQLNYTLTKARYRWLPLQNVNVYFYATNLGILWKANNKGIDPDFVSASYPNPKTFAFGLKTSL